LLEEASNIHPQNVKQPQITKHFDHITPIPITKSNEIDQALLKAW
ncbi:7974_t:CDS:1, partial [Diversispora eburnea]